MYGYNMNNNIIHTNKKCLKENNIIDKAYSVSVISIMITISIIDSIIIISIINMYC